MKNTQIFSIGSGKISQCTQGEGGVWYRRDRVGRYRTVWCAWYEIAGRPEGAWYNPAAGRARVPKREPIEAPAFTEVN
jgi:hypothetical protein